MDRLLNNVFYKNWRKVHCRNRHLHNHLLQKLFYFHLIDELIYRSRGFVSSCSTHLWHPWQVLQVTGSTVKNYQSQFPSVWSQIQVHDFTSQLFNPTYLIIILTVTIAGLLLHWSATLAFFWVYPESDLYYFAKFNHVKILGLFMHHKQ